MLSCPQRHIPPQEHIGPLPGRSARAKRPGYPGWDGRGHPVGRAAAARGSPHQPKIMNFEEKTSHSPGVTCGKRPCTWVAPPARHTSGSAVVSAHRGSQGGMLDGWQGGWPHRDGAGRAHCLGEVAGTPIRTARGSGTAPLDVTPGAGRGCPCRAAVRAQRKADSAAAESQRIRSGAGRAPRV